MVVKTISIVMNMLMMNSCQVTDMYFSSPAKDVKRSTKIGTGWKLLLLTPGTTRKTYVSQCNLTLRIIFAGITLGKNPFEKPSKLC